MRRALKRSLVRAAGVALLLGMGCGEKGPAGRDYMVRAQVVKPPDPAEGLYIYHEAIDGWTSRDGKVEGMDSMAMPFPVAQGVSLVEITTNDKVEVTMHVDWEAESPVEITRVRELPPETKLVFREAKPPRNP